MFGQNVLVNRLVYLNYLCECVSSCDEINCFIALVLSFDSYEIVFMPLRIQAQDVWQCVRIFQLH